MCETLNNKIKLLGFQIQLLTFPTLIISNRTLLFFYLITLYE